MSSSKKKITNYPFDKLTSVEWQKGAELGLNNAKDILMASKLCRENDLHATGNSLLISATEELVKALYIRIRAVTGKEPIPGFQKLFYDHIVKHDQIIRIVSIQFANQLEAKEVKDVKTVVVGLVVLAVTSAYILSFKEVGDRNPFSIEENRQTGLYLGFHKTKIKWLVPKQEINPESFDNNYKMITDFFNKVETQYFSINSEQNVLELYSELRELD